MDVCHRLLLSLVLCVGLAACTSDSGSDSKSGEKPPEGETATIVGRVLNGPVEGARVQVFGPDGALLGETTTGVAGVMNTLSISVPTLDIGYRLVASGGVMDGSPYEGTLVARCLGQQSHIECNVTPLTTLVDRMVAEGGFNTGDARSLVLSRLGVSQDPFLSGDHQFDLAAARAAMDQGRALDAWLDSFIDWLNDAQATPPAGAGETTPPPATTFTLQYVAGAGGQISGSASQTVTEGGSGSTVTAVAQTGFVFDRWSDGLTSVQRTDANVTADISVTAFFVSQDDDSGPSDDATWALTVQRTGSGSGTVTSSPEGISCGADCSEAFDEGTSVTLTAAAAAGSEFVGWSGACSGSSSSCSVSMSQARSVTAQFDALAPSTHQLTVSRSGSGSGSITSSPVGISCGADCNETFDEGTSVTLTATPAPDSVFAGWSGACSGNSLTCTLTMSQARSVTAEFDTIITYQLLVSLSGSGTGTVTSNPSGISCGAQCSDEFNSGTAVTLTASAAPGSVFAGWSGACTGASHQCNVTVTQAMSVTANFNALTAESGPAGTCPGGGAERDELLQLVNNARSLGRVCGAEGSFDPAPAVTWNCTLETAALGHSVDMGEEDFFSHTGSDGLSVSHRVTNAGYSWQWVGENIAAGQPTAAEVVQAWLDSPGHCANIMNPNFEEMGVSWYKPLSATYSIYWTQNFAKHQ